MSEFWQGFEVGVFASLLYGWAWAAIVGARWMRRQRRR